MAHKQPIVYKIIEPYSSFTDVKKFCESLKVTVPLLIKHIIPKEVLQLLKDIKITQKIGAQSYMS